MNRDREPLFQEDANNLEPSPYAVKKARKEFIKNIIFWIIFWMIINFVFWLFGLSSLFNYGFINILGGIAIFGYSLAYGNERWQTPLSYLDSDPQGTIDIMNNWSSRTVQLLSPGIGIIAGIIMLIIYYI